MRELFRKSILFRKASVLTALMRELFPDSPEIGFTTWMALALPLTAVFLPII